MRILVQAVVAHDVLPEERDLGPVDDLHLYAEGAVGFENPQHETPVVFYALGGELRGCEGDFAKALDWVDVKLGWLVNGQTRPGLLYSRFLFSFYIGGVQVCGSRMGKGMR